MKRRIMMNKYILKRKTFSKYDETDALKRMKDSDILAEERKKSPGYGSILRDSLLGAAGGAALGGTIGAVRKGGTLKKGATTGAILGGLVMGAAGIKKRNKEKEEQEFYNRRLDYAKRHARRRERIDWRANMTQRDGYSY